MATGGTTFSYRYNPVSSQWEDAGVTTTQAWSPDSLTIVGPGGCTTYYERDPLDRVLSATNAEGRVRYFEYDGNSTVIRAIVEPDGSRKTYLYTLGGSTYFQSADPAGRVAYFYYPMQGKLGQQTDPLGATTYWQWENSEFGPDYRVDPEGHVQYYQWDDRGHKIADDLPPFALPLVKLGSGPLGSSPVRILAWAPGGGGWMASGAGGR